MYMSRTTSIPITECSLFHTKVVRHTEACARITAVDARDFRRTGGASQELFTTEQSQPGKTVVNGVAICTAEG